MVALFPQKNPPYTDLFLLEWNFLFYALDVKHNVLHLLNHKLVGEMCIYSSYQSFRAVAHPNIHNVRANVLLANSCKRMAQEVLRYFFIVHNPLKNAVQHVRSM